MNALGTLEELELATLDGRTVVPCSGRLLVTPDGCGLVVEGLRMPWLDALRLGWRPWRRAIARVEALTYRSARFIERRGFGFVDRRGAARAARWGEPSYRHAFESARLEVGLLGRLVIWGGFSLDRTRLGGLGMIRG